MSQFLDTIGQILHSDSVDPVRGVVRHMGWQLRKLIRGFPCDLKIAHSKLHVERARGVAALVNAMGEYDYNNMRLLRLVLSSEKGTFIDIGANIGCYSLVASEIEGADVVSIEPHPLTFALLQENIRLNARRNVTCLNIAMSDKDGVLQFTDLEDACLNCVIQPGGAGQGLSIPSRRLDTLCCDLQIAPDFVKIDVEGHDFAVLAGFGHFRTTPKIIFIENGEGAEIQSWLNVAGYTGPWFPHFNRRVLSRARQLRSEDPVFIRRDFLAEVKTMGFEVAKSPPKSVLAGPDTACSISNHGDGYERFGH